MIARSDSWNNNSASGNHRPDGRAYHANAHHGGADDRPDHDREAEADQGTSHRVTHGFPERDRAHDVGQLREYFARTGKQVVGLPVRPDDALPQEQCDRDRRQLRPYRGPHTARTRLLDEIDMVEGVEPGEFAIGKIRQAFV